MLPTLLFAFATAQALVPNGSFEDVREGRPEGWRTQTWNGRATFSLSTEGRNGSRAVLIESSEGADAAWHVTARVKPYSKYRLQAYIRTEYVAPVNRGPGALINLHGRPERTQVVAGSTDWTPVEMTFDTGADDALQINCLLGFHGTAMGKAWFDDVTLHLLETRELKPQATIDATKTFEPISKYIYSQFIEHLGRCIYGGIWAEMLEDRKFFYPVDGRKPYEATREGFQKLVASPWIPDTGSSARHERTDFRAQPVLRLSGTVAQGGLTLQKGREYVLSVRHKGGAVTTSLRTAENETAAKSHPQSEKWKVSTYRFRSPESTEQASLALRGEDARIAAVSLMPADNVEGFRADTLQLLRELDAPLYRWPGGNFVSGYEWRDGIGERDKRPTIPNPAWSGIDTNDVGTHEFIRFCELVKSDPLIVVNTGLGDAHSAAAWVEYVNGKSNTEEGARRVKNGRREPWGVQWWGIGNEMYGPWQLGHMVLDQYVVKHRLVHDRMKAVDPAILTIASSDLGFGGWSERMLRDCANHMTLISEHFYCQEKESVTAHVAQIPNAIRGKVEAHRRFRETMPGLAKKGIKIAMDEWNYWYGPHVYGELGTRYFVKDGLGIAAGLHEFFRSTDMVSMAQYAQTVNVIGCIKTTPTAAAFETTGLVLKLYRKEFGTIPLEVGGTPEPLDVSAALTEDRKFMTLGVVNPTGEAVSLPLEWKGVSSTGPYRGWEIAHADPMAYNTPGEPPKVKIEEVGPERLPGGIQLKPYSVTLVRFPVQ